MKVSPLCQGLATLEYYQSLSFNIKHLGRSFIYLLYVRRVILKICKFAETMEELPIFMRLQPKILQGNGIICLSSLIDITEVEHLGVFFFVNHSLKLLGALKSVKELCRGKTPTSFGPDDVEGQSTQNMASL